MKKFVANKKIITCSAIFVGLIIILSVAVPNIIRYNEIATERGRNYYIEADDEYTFECNARRGNGFSIYCEDRFIDGKYSNYSTVKFSRTDDLAIYGDSFTKKICDSVDPDIYQQDDFNVDDLKTGIDKTHSLKLKNTVLDEIVIDKELKVHYDFTETDLELISQIQSEWATDKAEREAKAKQEEEERRIKAEEEAERRRVEAEKREAEEKAAREAAEKKAAEEKAAREAEERAAEYRRKYGYIGRYIEKAGAISSTDDIWTFNADGTATYTGNKNIVYKLTQDSSNYKKIRASSYYMDWILEFSDDWKNLKAINDFNGYDTDFIRMED